MESDEKKSLFLCFKVEWQWLCFKVEWQWKRHSILYILKVDYIN